MCLSESGSSKGGAKILKEIVQQQVQWADGLHSSLKLINVH